MNADFCEIGILSMRSVQLSAAFNHKNDAIYAAAELLVQVGAVDKFYLASMFRSGAVSKIWFGSGIVILHGIIESYDLMIRDAVTVVQIPAGVEWHDGSRARLIIAIFVRSSHYIEIFKKLTQILLDEQRLKVLLTTTDKKQVIKTLLGRCVERDMIFSGDLSICREWTLDYPNGLHVRPASIWVDFAKRARNIIRVRRGRYSAEMNNFFGLLQLAAMKGDVLVFSTDDVGGAQLLEDAIAVAKRVGVSEKHAV